MRFDEGVPPFNSPDGKQTYFWTHDTATGRTYFGRFTIDRDSGSPSMELDGGHQWTAHLTKGAEFFIHGGKVLFLQHGTYEGKQQAWLSEIVPAESDDPTQVPSKVGSPLSIPHFGDADVVRLCTSRGHTVVVSHSRKSGANAKLGLYVPIDLSEAGSKPFVWGKVLAGPANRLVATRTFSQSSDMGWFQYEGDRVL